jgi:hypothetical protein
MGLVEDSRGQIGPEEGLQNAIVASPIAVLPFLSLF